MTGNAEAILEKLDLIVDTLQERVDAFHLAYPTGGGTKTLPIGKTSVDFYNGSVIYPDGTRDKLPSSLKSAGIDYIRSCSLNINKSVVVNLDTMTGNMSSGRGLQCNVGNHKFRVLYITATEETEASVWASSEPANIFKKDAYMSIVGNYTDDAGVTIPVTVALDVDGYIKTTDAKPTEIISGKKTNISITTAQLTTVDTPIKKSVLVTCDSLGTGTYIALGNETSREFTFEAVGDWHEIDYIDNLDKLYVDTDAGNTSELSWIGG